MKSKSTFNPELPDDELHLEQVVHESARHEALLLTLLKLKFGSIFYRELWERHIRSAIAAAPSNQRLSCKMDRSLSVSSLPLSQELRASVTSVSPVLLLDRRSHPLLQDTDLEAVECDFSGVADILAMSSSRSENMRNICQRLVQLGQKNARHCFKYTAVDALVSAEESWNSDPPFFGLLEIAKNLLRQPSMFALTVGTLGHMTAVTCIVASHCNHNKLNNGPLSNQELWVRAQDHLIATLDSLLEEVVQKSKSISRLGSVSVLLLEITSARMSLVGIPSGKKMDLAKGVFKIVFGLAKSIVGMRLDPNLLSGLGMVASSSLALLKEGWAKNFCTRLSNISSLPDLCMFSQMSSEALKKLRTEVAHRFCNNLFISKRNFFTKSASTEIFEISRWEFHAAFAVMLTKLVLQLTHENLMRVNFRLNTLRSEETLRRVPIFQTTEVYFRRVDDRFVLQMLLEKLDEAPFVDVESFLKHLKDSDSHLSNLVHTVFSSKDEVLKLIEFHQNEQRLIAAVREIEEADRKCVAIKLNESVCIPSLPHVGDTPLTEDLRTAGVSHVNVLAAGPQVHQAFDLKFANYPSLQPSVEFIAHAKDLISDMIYGFLPSPLSPAEDTSKVLHGSEGHVKGLLELACYGLETSFDAVDSHPGFKLATWADRILSMTGTENLFQEGLVQLKDSLFDFVVRQATQFDTEELPDDTDSQVLFVAVDRRMNALKSSHEKLAKAANYVNRFSGLIKLLPLGSAASLQGTSYGETDSVCLFTSVKAKKIKEERSKIIEEIKAAISSNCRLTVAVAGIPEATVNSPLTEELLDSARSHGVFQVCITVEGEEFSKEPFKLDCASIPPSAVLADDVSHLDASLPLLAHANETLTKELVIKLQDAGISSVLVLKSRTLDIEHSVIGKLLAVDVPDIEEAKANSPLTVDMLEKLHEQEIHLSAFRCVEISEVFRELHTQSHDQNAFSPSEFINKFLEELLPAILQLLTVSVARQFDRLGEIKLVQGIDDQILAFNSSVSDITAYSEIASELQSYFGDLLCGPISKLVCEWKGIGSNVVNEIGSLVTTIKSDVILELKQLADSELVATGKEVVAQIGDVLNNVGIKSVFNSLGSLLSDYKSAKQAEQEPFRVREVACFCISLIAAATGSAELQLFLGRQRIKETHPSVKAVLNVTDQSN